MRTNRTELQTALDRFDIRLQKFVLARPFSDCFTGIHMSGNRVFIKVLQSTEPKIRRNFLREVSILDTLSGTAGTPVVRGFSLSSTLPFHACDEVVAPRLDEYLTIMQPGKLAHLLKAAGALARWILLLHRRGYVHRDLSPDHVFLTGRDKVTVVDFGMAKTTIGISLQQRRLYEGYDIQTFGMIFWELISGRLLFPYRSEHLPASLAVEIALLENVELPPGLIRLIVNCLSARSEFTPTGLRPNGPYENAEDLQRAVALLKVGHCSLGASAPLAAHFFPRPSSKRTC